MEKGLGAASIRGRRLLVPLKGGDFSREVIIERPLLFEEIRYIQAIFFRLEMLLFHLKHI